MKNLAYTQDSFVFVILNEVKNLICTKDDRTAVILNEVKNLWRKIIIMYI
jgi:hypothetical protein